VPLECDSADRRNFYGEIRHRQIGLIGIADVKASAMCARRTPAMIAHAPSDDLIVVLHMEGICHAGQNADTAKLVAGQGAMVVTDDRYFFEFPNHFRQLVLKLPTHLLAKDRIGLGRRRGLSLAPVPVRLLERLALSTLEEPAEFSIEEEIGIEIAIAELLRAASPPISVVDASGAYSRACRFIRCHLSNPNLKPATIAEELKMSQRNLARLFARHGTTIERAIWADRLAAAKRDLLDPRLADQSVTEIAFSWAFSDTAHFSRRFCKAYGLPPTAYRLVYGKTRSD